MRHPLHSICPYFAMFPVADAYSPLMRMMSPRSPICPQRGFGVGMDGPRAGLRLGVEAQEVGRQH
jgi:hypothetical protein